MRMIWKKTRLSCSVRLSDGLTYSYRSLNVRKKRLLMKCSRSSCKASVAIDISGYMLSQDVNDKSKRTSTAVLLDIDRLIRISKYEPQLDEKEPIFFSLYYNVLLRQQIRLYPFLKSDKTFVFIYLSLMN